MGIVEGWVAFGLWLWLVARTYGYLRDRWFPQEDSSWVAGVVALFLAFNVCPVMPVVMIRTWVLTRRGAMPLAEQRRRARRERQRRTVLTSRRTMSELR